MKQVSPARLTHPLLRKPGSERGAGEFEAISWERAFDILTERLAPHPRHRPEEASRSSPAATRCRRSRACSRGSSARRTMRRTAASVLVNMAAGMIYTIGGSFWEFGGPDLDHARLFVMMGTAEDHHSNPMKIALGEVQASGRPLHLDQPGAHRLFGHRRRVDPDQARHRRRAVHGAAARADPQRPDRPRLPASASPTRRSWWCWTRASAKACSPSTPTRPRPARRRPPPAQQAGVGREQRARAQRLPRRHRRRAAIRRSKATTRLADGTRVAPSFQLLRERVASCTPRVGRRPSPGIPAERIRQLARELGETALQQAFELPIPWTDAWGKVAPDDAGSAGRFPCDARPGRAFQRLPDGACAGRADERAGHHRRTRAVFATRRRTRATSCRTTAPSTRRR